MKLTALYLKEALIKATLMVFLFVAPIITFAQEEDLPNPADNAQDPGVPFDGNMNMIFLAIGVLFAVAITVRQLRKRSAAINS